VHSGEQYWPLYRTSGGIIWGRAWNSSS
jgi:hypothetical protein